MSFNTLLNNTKTYTITSPYGNRMSFTFMYVRIGSYWRAYILSSPSYGCRSTLLTDTHRYYDDSRNLYYVCWTVNLLRLEDMIEVSQLWARETVRYIGYGESF